VPAGGTKVFDQSMKSSLAISLPESAPFVSAISRTTAVFRGYEKILLAYFVYVAVMLSSRPQAVSHRILAWTIPLALIVGFALESHHSAPWSRVTRDWLALGLILVAYREVDWLGDKPPLSHLQDVWIRWDHIILDQMGVRAAIEAFGGFIPSMLEAVYLSLYAIPAICIATLYRNGGRPRIQRFLATLMLGTLCAYVLLPFFPSVSPRLAFPSESLPAWHSVWRTINIWLLEHGDIDSSVFPSGHVAVAFSCAFGLLRAIPERRTIWLTAFLAAILVFTATIYCRYHYAVDGLASIGISIVAWGLTVAMDRDA
jgi:membrane-associated phospholipid phosphatase